MGFYPSIQHRRSAHWAINRHFSYLPVDQQSRLGGVEVSFKWLFFGAYVDSSVKFLHISHRKDLHISHIQKMKQEKSRMFP